MVWGAWCDAKVKVGSSAGVALETGKSFALARREGLMLDWKSDE